MASSAPVRGRSALFVAASFLTYRPLLRHPAAAPKQVSVPHASFTKRQITIGAATPSPSAPGRQLFAYTSGRYVYKEKLRLAERYVEFNVDALKRIAAQSVNREGVAHIKKLAEGGFNRVLLLTMNDGLEVIVKIPYTIAVPKKLTTESEVATLDFLRSKGIPVPEVYAWSSEAENDVGTEYIMMEKASGKPLEERWFDLAPREQPNLVMSYVEVERKLFSIHFGSYGSIYYRTSLPQHSRMDLYASGSPNESDDTSRFCIGPTADYMFWRGKRAQLGLNRGPWRHHCDYLYSTGWKEKEYTKKFGKPKMNEFPHNTILKGEMAPEAYVDLLDQYLSVSPYLLPDNSGDLLNRPTMRHPDLNPTNIYVSDSCEISCIIDWQHTTILPLALAAGNPPMFENPDPEPPKDYSKPTLPEHYESLGTEEKSQADELHRRRMLFYLYMVFNAKDNKLHLEALRYPMLMLIQHLVDRAGRPWTGNIVTLKGALLRVINRWDELTTSKSQRVSCPVIFEPDDEKEFYQLEENWFKCNFLVEHWRSVLDNLGQDGWFRNESFEKVTEANRQMKKQWIDEGEDEEDVSRVEHYWPFQDHEEDD